jgi:hypothetical protein
LPIVAEMPSFDGMADFELKPSEFRPIQDKPLGRPKTLWFGACVFGIGTLLGAYSAAHVAGWWVGLIPVPCAILLGVCIAGLFPAIFNDDRR